MAPLSFLKASISLSTDALIYSFAPYFKVFSLILLTATGA